MDGDDLTFEDAFERMTAGPGRFFVEHPGLYAASLVSAAITMAAFMRRASRGRSRQARIWWGLLAASQAAQIVSMWRARQAAARD